MTGATSSSHDVVTDAAGDGTGRHTVTDDVYLLLDPAWMPRSADDEEAPPANAVIGSWPVRHGSPGPLRPNPAYVPSHEASPTDAVDALIRLLLHGEVAEEHLAPLLHDAVVEVATDGGAHPVHVRSPDGPRCQVVATSRRHRDRTHLPAWRRVSLTGLLRSLPDDVDLLVNPGGPTPARLDGGFLRRTLTGSASTAFPDADEHRAEVATSAVPGPRHLPGYLDQGGGIGDAHVRSWGDVLQRLIAQARAAWLSVDEYRPLPADPAHVADGEPGTDAARDLEAWLSVANISARWDSAVGPSGIDRTFVRRGRRRDTVVNVNLRVTLLGAADTGPVPDPARGTGDGAGSGLRVVQGTVGLRLTVTRHDTSARRRRARAPGRRGLRVPSVGVTVADPSPVPGELTLHVRGDDMRSAPAAPLPDATVGPGPVDPVHPAAAPGVESAMLPGTTVLFVGGSEAVKQAASEAVDEALGHDRVPGSPGVVRWRSLSDAMGADRLRRNRDVFGPGIVIDDLVCGSQVFERIGEVTTTMSLHDPRLVSDGGTAVSAPDRDAWPAGLRTCVVQADARATVTFTGGRAAERVDGVPSRGGRSSTRHADLPGQVFLRVDRAQARAWGLLPGPPELPVIEPPGSTDGAQADLLAAADVEARASAAWRDTEKAIERIANARDDRWPATEQANRPDFDQDPGDRGQQQEAEREQQQAERQQAEREQQERTRRDEAERERVEREQAARVERERAERVEREQAARVERERAERVERERAEQVERERAEQVERERAARIEQERVEQVERERAARVEQERVERERAEQVERKRAERERAEQVERERAERVEQERVERERVERETADQADREAAESAAVTDDPAPGRGPAAMARTAGPQPTAPEVGEAPEPGPAPQGGVLPPGDGHSGGVMGQAAEPVVLAPLRAMRDRPSTPPAEGGHAADAVLDGRSPHRPDDPAAAAVGTEDRVLESGPVDVVTGEVVLEQADLRPAGPDGVVLGRTYVSTYRAGRLFGPRWASTLDQRLEVDAEGVCYVADDGRVLVYPPTGDVSLPVAGPRWPLRAVAGGYELHRDGAEVLRFARRGGDAGVHPLVELRDRTGAVTAVEHDTAGVPVAVAGAGWRFELGHADGRLVEVRRGDAAPGGPLVVLSFGYDAGGRLTQVVDPSGLPVVLQYDHADRLVGWQDRGGHWYRYVHDADGRCVRTVGEGGHGDGAFVHDPQRRTTTYRDALGHTSTFEYDEHGRVVRRTDPLGHVTASVWDREGRLRARTDPLGRTTVHEYADTGDGRRPVRTVGPDGRVVRPVADAAPAPRPAAPGEVRSPEGRLVARGAERWVHDGDGNVVEHVDAAGRVTRHEYGVLGIRTARVDPAGVRTVFGHDRELRLVSVTTSRGLEWRYSYDAAGRMTGQTDFDGRVTRFEHDAAGQLVAVVDAAGGRTELGYDARGALVSRRTAEGTTTFGYDEHGRLVSASAPGSSLHVDRDAAGRVVAQTVDGRMLMFSYCDEDRTVWRRTPSGATSAWRFAPDGSAASLASAWHVLDLDRDAAGHRTRLRVDGTTVLRQRRADDGALAAVEVGWGAAAHRREFVRHPDGRPAAVRDGTGETRFALDPVGRVSSVVGPGRAESYRYDDLGAVSSSVVATGGGEGRPQAREVRGTTLLRCGGTRFEHDVLGRVTARVERAADGSERRWDHTWDSLGQLVGIRTPDGERWRYRYDPLGRRTSKERLDDDGWVVESVRFTWDGTVLVEADHVGYGAPSRVTTWNHEPADGSPVVQVEAWFGGPSQGRPDSHRLRVVVTDAVGTPVLLADPHGAVTWRATGTVWGAPTGGGAAGPDAEGTPLRFPGQYLDGESGLHHNVYRYYDPTTARYLSPDPLGLEPAPHPVAYVGNPLHELDPLGLAGVCGPGSAVDGDVVGVGGGVGGGGRRPPGSGWTAEAAAGTASSGYGPDGTDGGSGR